MNGWFHCCGRRPIGLAAIVSTLLAISMAAIADDSQATLVVHVTGLRSHKGQLRIGIWTRAQGWMEQKYGLTGQDILLDKATGDAINVTFHDLTPGDYAVGTYHDANMNFKIDKNWIGEPKEEWGVSNNVRPRLRAPRYEEARFRIAAPETRITIQLHR